jgi:hypothetical protein
MPSCSYAKSLAPRIFRSLLAEKGLEKGAGARNSPAHFLLQRLPFSSACRSPAPAVLQRLPILQHLPFSSYFVSSHFLSPATFFLQTLLSLSFSGHYPSLAPSLLFCLWYHPASGVRIPLVSALEM